MGVNGIATLWGLAEATLFFVVPDVWLTAIVVWSSRRALLACLYTLAGALVGGAIMYAWGVVDRDTALRILAHIPAIGATMIDQVAAEIREHGLLAPFFGPIKGVPYKIYAVQAPAQGIGLGAFLLISIPARLIRFVLLTLVAWLISHRLCASWTPHRKMLLLGSGWAAFYLWYFLYFLSMP